MYQFSKSDDSPIITISGERFTECPRCDMEFRKAAAVVDLAKELKVAA